MWLLALFQSSPCLLSNVYKCNDAKVSINLLSLPSCRHLHRRGVYALRSTTQSILAANHQNEPPLEPPTEEYMRFAEYNVYGVKAIFP
ncbi:hypothetical protein F5Y08DRAFT_233441 [Xylaria arbuscula]|nr:hypothetical protein F5Y08DRAFT_233441 [Xylaria arbuscula]